MADTLETTITRLKAERNAILLAHNYTRPEVQDIADFVGDSLGLSRTAAETKADIIVFSGVHFMAETAAILCPEKRVFLPDCNAGCPMANMVTERELIARKEEHPDAVVVTYVNSSAAIKAMSDICCTSANAIEIVRSIPEECEVLFVPDRNLGHYVSTVLDRNLILWNGYCPTHQRILPEVVAEIKDQHPEALFVAHPECRPAVLKLADTIGSTSGILKFCRQSNANEFIIGTEEGLLHRLQVENPGKSFYTASVHADCPNMKLASLEKIAWCLEELSGEITVPSDVADKAREPIQRMIDR